MNNRQRLAMDYARDRANTRPVVANKARTRVGTTCELCGDDIIMAYSAAWNDEEKQAVRAQLLEKIAQHYYAAHNAVCAPLGGFPDIKTEDQDERDHVYNPFTKSR